MGAVDCDRCIWFCSKLKPDMEAWHSGVVGILSCGPGQGVELMGPFSELVCESELTLEVDEDG